MERELAAILVADVVVDSRLMGERENLRDDGVDFAARRVTLAEGGNNCKRTSQL